MSNNPPQSGREHGQRVPYERGRSPVARPRPTTWRGDGAPQRPVRRGAVAPASVPLVGADGASRTTKRASKIVIGMLLGLAVLAVWQIFFVQRDRLPPGGLAGLLATPVPVLQIPPLLDSGITLGATMQKPAVNQQQALLLANQLETDAAASARHVEARYVLLNYTPRAGGHAGLTNVAAWLIWYQNVPQPPSDPATDPTPVARSQHDLYVFLDAQSGHELLTVWA